MTAVGSKTRMALGAALTKDRHAAVDVNDARKIVQTALDEIAAALDPQVAFDKTLPTVMTARRFLGERDAGPAARLLSGFEKRALSAVNLRLQELAGDTTLLPPDLQTAFNQMAEEQRLASGAVKFSKVAGSVQDGFTFSWTAQGQEQDACALRYKDQWCFTPVRVTGADLDRVTKAFQSWFDKEWATDLKDNGASAAELRRMRALFLPERALFPGKRDPANLVDRFSLVFSLNNPTGSQHRCYVGYNPHDKSCEPCRIH